MATIEDLTKSISEMSEEELYERIRALRLDRRTKKMSRQRGKTPTKKPSKIDGLVSSLSKEEAAELADLLEGVSE